jgi:hypothetical protein
MFIYLRDGIRMELPSARTVSIQDDKVLIQGSDDRPLAYIRKADLLAFSHRDLGEVWPNESSQGLQAPSSK